MFSAFRLIGTLVGLVNSIALRQDAIINTVVHLDGKTFNVNIDGGLLAKQPSNATGVKASGVTFTDAPDSGTTHDTPYGLLESMLHNIADLETLAIGESRIYVHSVEIGDEFANVRIILKRAG